MDARGDVEPALKACCALRSENGPPVVPGDDDTGSVQRKRRFEQGVFAWRRGSQEKPVLSKT
jgi:hypothetical protein